MSALSPILTTLLAQLTTPTAEPPTWGNLVLSIVSGIPVAAVLGWRLKLADDKERAKDQELHDTNEKLLALAERAIPVLAESTRALTDVSRRHDDGEGTVELRRSMLRLEQQLGGLVRDNPRDNRRD
jgi:hypothetical protein